MIFQGNVLFLSYDRNFSRFFFGRFEDGKWTKENQKKIK